MSERHGYTPPTEPSLSVQTELRRIENLDTSLIDMSEEIQRTYRVVRFGSEQEITSLAPHDLIFLFQELQTWLPLTTETQTDEIIFFQKLLDDAIITLGEAVKSTDERKKATYIKGLIQRIRKHHSLLEQIYTVHEQKASLEEETTYTDATFFDTFDPSIFSYETITEHTERFLLSLEQVLHTHEHKEVYQPILDHLSTAISQTLYQSQVRSNRAYYTPGGISLRDISTRMGETHWRALCNLFQTYPQMYRMVEGKLPDELNESVSPLIFIPKEKSTKAASKNTPNLAIANILAIALSEEIKSANSGSDAVRPRAQQLLDEWYGPHKPKDIFEHEDILWNIILQEAVQSITNTEVRKTLEDIQKKLPRRITKENAPSAIKTLFELLDAANTPTIPRETRAVIFDIANKYIAKIPDIIISLFDDLKVLTADTNTPQTILTRVKRVFAYISTYAPTKETYEQEKKQKYNDIEQHITDIFIHLQILAQAHPESISAETLRKILITVCRSDVRQLIKIISSYDILRDISKYKITTELKGLDIRDTILPQNCRTIHLNNTRLGGKEALHILKTNKDFRWANLSGADLRGANLRWANLSGADLRGADLRGADLRWAILPNDCSGMIFTGSRLDKAEVVHILKTNKNLRGADLREAVFRRVDLHEVDLHEADLRGADLRGAILPNDCSGMIFTGSRLDKAEVVHILKTNKNLRGADLYTADLSQEDLSGADLNGAELRLALLYNANLSETNLRQTNLRLANLRWADLSGADLSGADLRGATLPDDCSGMIFTDTRLDKAEVVHILKTNKNLRGADLRRVDLHEVDLYEADLREADLSGATLPDDCSSIIFTGAKLDKIQKKHIIKNGGTL